MSNLIQKGKSFHIEQLFGTAWITMWPPASFGMYCTDKKDAQEQLAQYLATEGPNFRLVSLTAVQDETGRVHGVVRGTHVVEK